MTSFRKRTVQKPIRGTRTSPHTAQVITSSGNPSLDLIFGGGLPIGSICLIEEDRFMTHAKVLAKYFLAEGLVSQQEIFLASLDDLPREILSRLPKPLSKEELEREQLQEQQASEQSPDKNALRIAFRYNDLPLINSEQATAKIGHRFNLMEHMDSIFLHYVRTTIWDGTANSVVKRHNSESSLGGFAEYIKTLDKSEEVVGFQNSGTGDFSTKSTANNNNNNNTTTDISTANTTISTTQSSSSSMQMFASNRYRHLLTDLQQLLQDKSFIPTGINTQQKNLCRVCITSLGSPLWYDDHFAEDLLKFLTILRASVRSCTSVCFITMPMHLIAKYDTSLVPKIRQLVDYAIELESFAGSEKETHPAFKEYSGLLHLHKMSALNTLAVHMPETTDLAFKLRRKKFVIEKLHLPPELQEVDATKPTVTVRPNCASNVSKNSNVSMDF